MENEYRGSAAYVDWCGQLAQDMGVGIPWEMCNGMSAANTINSCNGGDCTGVHCHGPAGGTLPAVPAPYTGFIEEHGQNGKVLLTQPALWTEDWIGWYQQWDNGSPPGTGDAGEASNKAVSVAKWFARGGSHHNYYMW